MVRMYGGLGRVGPTAKRIHKKIAHSTGLVKVLKSSADGLADDAGRILATAKKRTGDSKIERSRGKLDEYVELRSPGGFHAVLGIEFGNKHGGGGIGPLRGAMNKAARGYR